MKAAIKHYERWEEENWLLLLVLSYKIKKALLKNFRSFWIALSFVAYISLQVLKGLGLFLRLIFLSEPAISRVERNEAWIFRSIR